MNRKQRHTLKKVFQDPVPANIPWKDIESLFIALGAKVSEGKGSRIRMFLNDTVVVFHGPHPDEKTDHRAIKDVRKFLISASINPENTNQ